MTKFLCLVTEANFVNVYTRKLSFRPFQKFVETSQPFQGFLWAQQQLKWNIPSVHLNVCAKSERFDWRSQKTTKSSSGGLCGVPFETARDWSRITHQSDRNRQITTIGHLHDGVILLPALSKCFVFQIFLLSLEKTNNCLNLPDNRSNSKHCGLGS